MSSIVTTILLWALFASTLIIIKTDALPTGFTVEVAQSGVELVWSSNTTGPVRVGGSRPEFRLPTGSVFGYPRVMQGKLVLPMSIGQQELLATADGQKMEVWSSGRRLDSIAAPANVVKPDAVVADQSTAASTPTVAVNPAARGSFNTTRLSYKLSMLDLNTPDFPFPLEVVGEVTLPTLLQANVKYPLVLFLHGRHATCFLRGPNGFDSGDWPCPDGWLPIPSHKGYHYVADVLASQGYVTVSISANGINGQDFAALDGGAAARSILIRHHLALWARWNTRGGDPWSGRFRGKLAMDKVVLVGHSRGGEGVNRAAIDASISDPFKIVGIVSYGPTAFGRQVTPDVHSATILPTCDGDVSDLQGQAYIDNSRDIAPSEALRSAVIALGCNHNFFNTEWTPGLAKAPAFDDWFIDDDPACGSKVAGGLRLTPKEQQVVGSAYTLALVRLAVRQEAAMLQLLDGSFVRPAAIGRADVSVHAVGGAANRLLYRPESESVVQLRNGMTGEECFGYSNDFFGSDDVFFPGPGTGTSVKVCGDGEFFYSSPHWLPIYGLTQPAPQAMELRWTKAGAYARFNLPSSLTNLTSLDWVDIRVANDPNSIGANLSVMVVDKNGRNATALSNLTTIDAWPLYRVHARNLRGSLTSVRSKVDLNNIVAVLLVTRSASGRIWVIDIAASQARIKQPVVLNLPVVSIESTTSLVPEGNGPKTYNLKVTVDQPLKSPGAIWFQRSQSEGYQIDLAAGSSTVITQIPYSWVGDKLFSFSSSSFSDPLIVTALKGVVTSNYISNGITIEEDDPIPTLTVVSKNVTAIEGNALRWQFRLSAPTTGTSLFCYLIMPKGTELTSQDVPSSWIQQASFGSLPTSPVPLSDLAISVPITFAYGSKSASLIVPISPDRKSENKESMACELFTLQGDVLTLTGEVGKH